jgi:hypothetical protein
MPTNGNCARVAPKVQIRPCDSSPRSRLVPKVQGGNLMTTRKIPRMTISTKRGED